MTSPSARRPASLGERWGFRDRPAVEGTAKKFALLAGSVYVGIGIVGFFVTGFNNFTMYTGETLLIFGITPFHNVVHIGIGAVWLLAAFALTRAAAEGTNFAIGGFYVLAAVLGYLGSLEFLGVMAPLAADNFLHLITGVVTLAFAGLVPIGDQANAPARA